MFTCQVYPSDVSQLSQSPLDGGCIYRTSSLVVSAAQGQNSRSAFVQIYLAQKREGSDGLN